MMTPTRLIEDVTLFEYGPETTGSVFPVPVPVMTREASHRKGGRR
jgi:hypothetical protein